MKVVVGNGSPNAKACTFTGQSIIKEQLAENGVDSKIFQVGNQQVKAHEIMKKYREQIQAWAPFAEGRSNLFGDETLKAVGDNYNKSNAQVALIYLMQRGVVW